MCPDFLHRQINFRNCPEVQFKRIFRSLNINHKEAVNQESQASALAQLTSFLDLAFTYCGSSIHHAHGLCKPSAIPESRGHTHLWGYEVRKQQAHCHHTGNSGLWPGPWVLKGRRELQGDVLYVTLFQVFTGVRVVGAPGESK